MARLLHGIVFDDQSLSSLNASQWSVLKQHEDLVRFINQAIEWESVVTYLYSCFWDLLMSWAFIRNYPGIPPANPARSAVRLQDAVFTTCSAVVATGRFAGQAIAKFGTGALGARRGIGHRAEAVAGAVPFVAPIESTFPLLGAREQWIAERAVYLWRSDVA